MEQIQEQAVAYLKGELTAEEQGAFEAALARSEDLRIELSRSRELLELLEAASEKSVAARVERQIRNALSARASDIHIVPGPHEVVVRNRVNGVLQEVERYPRSAHEAVLDRWKLLAGASLSEKTLPQEGRIVELPESGNPGLRVPVQFLPTFHGERITARILDPTGVIVELERLTFSPHHLEAVRRLAALPQGLVICAGPTGCGKGTVLYSMLKAMDTDSRNVMTIEEPVEYVLPGVSHVGLNRRLGFGYLEAFRSVMHSDPDVVMVGELRDSEAAELAIEVVLTGHLVPTTLHALSALAGVERLREFGITTSWIAQSLAGIIGQRLVRRVCARCAEEYQPAADALTQLGLSPDEAGTFRRGRGCDACRGTGFLGRVALYEVLEVDDDLRSLLSRTSDPAQLWEHTFGAQGGSLWEDARRKVREGIVTAEKVAAAMSDYPHPTTAG